MNWTVSRRKFLIHSAWLAGATYFAPGHIFANKKKQVTFGILTDSHYADRNPSGTRYYRESREKMRAAIDTLNQKKVDFVVHLGDFKDERPDKQESDTLQFLQTIESEYARFKGPRYHCIGNHDLDSISKDQFQQQVVNSEIEQNLTYFSFDQHGHHFIVLDPNFHADGRPHHKGDFEWFDAHLTSDQWNWFENDLKTTSLPTIVFSHFTLYEFVRGDAVFHVSDYQRAQQLMERSGKVIACFHGHTHEENYQEINGIHYCTHFGMVDYSGLDNNSFAIVTISDDTITIDGYQRCGDRKLSFQ